MINLQSPGKDVRFKRAKRRYGRAYKRRQIISVGRKSLDIINELCAPIDATNRFINLSLQETGEGSQSREFLLESKKGIRKASSLIKRLNAYSKKIEDELREISTIRKQRKYPTAK